MTTTATDSLEADYVVVGGGSAGAVIAARLSEDPDVLVTLIEAGGEARSLLIEVPCRVRPARWT